VRKIKNQLSFFTYCLLATSVDGVFGLDVDYAMLVKMYGATEGSSQTERKYSPNECNGTKKMVITGEPHRKFISTSYVERSNLSIRMGNRRFIRIRFIPVENVLEVSPQKIFCAINDKCGYKRVQYECRPQKCASRNYSIG
jgi:hypothetical protein